MVPIRAVMVTLKSTVQNDTHGSAGRHAAFGTDGNTVRLTQKKDLRTFWSSRHKITIKHWYFKVAGFITLFFYCSIHSQYRTEIHDQKP